MSDTDYNDSLLPAPIEASLPIGLQIMFNDRLFARCKEMATFMSKAEGFAPRHLIGKPEACFAVIGMSMTWRLDPWQVARACYMTPGGSLGYFGALCQSIIENSGRLEGGVRFRHYGDWQKLRGRFKLVPGQRGGTYPEADWPPEDEIGLGVTVSAQVKGELEPRELDFDLSQAHPRNSTLWASDPKTQICYTAVRRFGNVSVPALFMGVPFDHDDGGPTDWGRDVTPPPPRPQRTRAQPAAKPEPTVTDVIVDPPPAEPAPANDPEPSVAEKLKEVFAPPPPTAAGSEAATSAAASPGLSDTGDGPTQHQPNTNSTPTQHRESDLRLC